MSKLVRLGIAGAPRGRSFLAGLASFSGSVDLVAVYEPDPVAAADFSTSTGVPTTLGFDALLDRVDAVIVASPQHFHGPQAVAALERGVHVLSEVPAVVTLEQAQALLTAVRNSTAQYMMAENYCYKRSALIIRAMTQRGLFGDLYFGEGEYIHEMHDYHYFSDGQPTWRYFWQAGRAGNTYPTHSLGPLLQWFNDRVVAVSCVGTGRHTAQDREIDDTVLLLARTSGGALLKIRLDLLSRRPHLMDYYSLQGTGGAYEAPRIPGTLGQIYLAGTSPHGEWEPLDNYSEKFLPSGYRDTAAEAGHGGSDTWPIRDFLDSIIADRQPPIDVYAALDMTLPGIVSEASFYEGGVWKAVPNPRLSSAGVGTDPGREAPLT